MKLWNFPLLASVALFSVLMASSSHAQQTTSARDALTMVSNQFGPRSTQWVAEMRGTGGIPQPPQWEITSYDDRMPSLLYRFSAGLGRVGDLGPESRRYPVDVPVGYFSPSQVGVDSVAAFTIAEGQARKARVAFDSCEYLLRAREFSSDPLWRLELLDARRQIVGKIYISAKSGTVLRTVWVYADRGGIRIVDSASPGGAAPTSTGTSVTGITGTDFPEAAEPNGETGIVQMRPRSTTITPPNPGSSVTIPPPPTPGGVRQPYQPVTPDGRIAGAPTTGNGTATSSDIPDPPAITKAPPASTGQGQMRDLREDPPARRDPIKPPIDIPSSGGGSSERIPPPPVPPAG
jgi:hypothetical protein